MNTMLVVFFAIFACSAAFPPMGPEAYGFSPRSLYSFNRVPLYPEVQEPISPVAHAPPSNAQEPSRIKRQIMGGMGGGMAGAQAQSQAQAQGLGMGMGGFPGMMGMGFPGMMWGR